MVTARSSTTRRTGINPSRHTRLGATAVESGPGALFFASDRSHNKQFIFFSQIGLYRCVRNVLSLADLLR